MLSNLIEIKNPDIAIYRIFKMKDLRAALEQRKLKLTPPASWDDPFENILTKCSIVYEKEARQEFLEQIRKPIFAQCWSLIPESDAIWRIYSVVKKKDPMTDPRNMDVNNEGVRVRSTARKLLTTLWNGCPEKPADTCFLGQIIYMSGAKIKQYIANEIARKKVDAFSGGRGHAESLLFKRDEFKHEQEVRLIYVRGDTKKSSEDRLFIPIDPNELFDEIMLDPRLEEDDERERTIEIRNLGFQNPISRSQLYQKYLFQVIVDR